MLDNHTKLRRRFSIGTIVCAALAVIALAVCAILMIRTDIPPVTIIYSALGAYLFLLLLLGVYALIRHRMRKSNFWQLRESVFGTLSLGFLENLYMPVLICDEKGKIVWHNPALKAQFSEKTVLHNKYVDSICNETIQQLEQGQIEATFGLSAEVNKSERVFSPKAYKLSYEGKPHYAVIFQDVSEIKRLNTRLAEEDTVVAYVVIDNLEELMLRVQEIYATAVPKVEQILRDYVEEKTGGIVRNYGNNKFMLVFAAKDLCVFEQDRFSVLEKVREIRVGDSSLPVTLSIGVSKISGTLYEKERAAQEALDMALQRGGDQVVIKGAESAEFYGGKTKNFQNRTKVRARVLANEFLFLISNAENVLIMGHKFPDFDAFASCIAVLRLAKYCKVPAHIICDTKTSALQPCFRRIQDNPEYANVFVDKTAAQELMRSGTLAVVVDVNNMEVCEAPDVVNMAKDYVIIDHHRKTADFKIPPKMAYIEPSASSASELLSEFLELLLPQGFLPKREAEFLLSGIVLDTKNFMHNTNERTFAAAMYLRGLGADTLVVKDFFKMGLDDFRLEAGFENNIRSYRSVITVATNDSEDNPPSARVNASRAADRLLHVEGVEASFALCRIGDSVHISARSQGKINVQLILEKMGGGGHFDSAGAQMKDSTVANALTMLYAAIDEYFNENPTWAEEAK